MMPIADTLIDPDDQNTAKPAGNARRVGDAETLAFLATAQLPLANVVLALFEQSDDCVKVIDRSGQLQFMNQCGRGVMEVDDVSTVVGRPWSALWPEAAKATIDAAVAQSLAGELTRFEAFCPTARGAPRWWDVSVSPVRDAGGHVVCLIASSRDISERRTREAALKTISEEMRHRLRNAFTMCAALTGAAGREWPDHREFATDLGDRLRRLADVQDRLLDATDGRDGLVDLVDAIVQAFAGSAGRIEVESLPPVRLFEARARALALVLGELCTNSLKHGALGHGGLIRISASIDGPQLALHWSERADALPESKAKGGGQGVGLMKRLLELHGGSSATEWHAGGPDVDIRLPLS